MDNRDQKIRELESKISALKETRKTLRRNFQGMVQLLSEIISLSSVYLGGHLKRTSEMIKSFRSKQNLSKDSIYLGYYSALLHDIGLIGETQLIGRREEDLSPEDITRYRSHAVTGYEILDSIYNLKRIALSVRSHHENYDGSGYPDKLAGKEIPEEARLIRIISDYDNFRFLYNLTPGEAIEKLEVKKGNFYDPSLLNEFGSFIDFYYKNDSTQSIKVSLEELKPGMYTDEDIYLTNGVLLIPKGIILDDLTISKIMSFAHLLKEGTFFRVIY